ncbi:hypothetical protein HQ400_16140 [Aeromonas jandaei]|nr:hypothetical protein HQ400_16140 [Aeromonas jandaei]
MILAKALNKNTLRKVIFNIKGVLVKSLKAMICKLQNMRDVIRRKLAILMFDRKGSMALDTIVVKEKIRVLVYRLDAKWGDSIISSFFYREIKKKGNVEVIVVSTQELYSLYKKSYNVDTVYSLKKRPSYRELWDVAKDIGKVDVVVHLTEIIKMKELFFISKISPEIVFSLDDGLSIVSHKMGEQSKNISFRDKYCAVLSMLNVYDIKKNILFLFAMRRLEILTGMIYLLILSVVQLKNHFLLKMVIYY